MRGGFCIDRSSRVCVMLRDLGILSVWSLNKSADHLRVIFFMIHCVHIFFEISQYITIPNFFFYLKGKVHPKITILSSFTHPQVVPNLYECLCSAEHKGRYYEECRKQSSSGTPLISIVFFFLLWKSMMPQNSLVTNFHLQQNDIHTGLELLEGE